MKSKCDNASAHCRAVVLLLDRLVKSLEGLADNESSLTEIFQKAGEQHANLGLQSKHYFLLCEALLSMLEYFLKSSSGYWQRVQHSWVKLFRVMVETIKLASKNEERRQNQLMRTNRRTDRKGPQTSVSEKPPTLNIGTHSTRDSIKQGLNLDFSLPLEEERHDLHMERSSKSMRNLFATSPVIRPKHDGKDGTKEYKPASLRNFFAASSPDKPLRKQVAGHSKSVSIRHDVACDIPTSQNNVFERKTNVRQTSLRHLLPKVGSIENGSAHSLPPSPPPSACPRSSQHSSPRSVTSPSAGRPGLSRSHSGSRRRDCAVYAMDSPGTPGTRRAKKENSSIESTPRKQLRRKMSKGGME
jgi:hypothetical protein